MKTPFALIGLLIASQTVSSQIVVNADARISPVRNTEKLISGASAQYLVSNRGRMASGIGAGIMVDYNLSTYEHSFEFPFLLHNRLYVLGSHFHEGGGLYLDLNAGVVARTVNRNAENPSIDQRTLPQYSLGLGIKTPGGYELHTRCGYQNGAPFMGFRLGYTFGTTNNNCCKSNE
jgi:hypothetical protein